MEKNLFILHDRICNFHNDLNTQCNNFLKSKFFIFFGIIILSAFVVYLNNFTYKTNLFFFLIFFSFTIYFTAIIYPPTIYYILGRDFYFYRKLYRLSKKEVYKPEVFLLELKSDKLKFVMNFRNAGLKYQNEKRKSIHSLKNHKDLSSVLLIEYKPIKLIEFDNKFYAPKKKLSAKIKQQLDLIYNEKANEFFDITIVDLETFKSKLFTLSTVSISYGISLYKHLSNTEILEFLLEINAITKIDLKKLTILFWHDHKPLNYNSLKTLKSQLNQVNK